MRAHGSRSTLRRTSHRGSRFPICLGLESAASLVEEVLRYRKVVPRGPLVLGGFSQGAMVASEVAFRTKVPLSALIVLSGTLVDEPSWENHFRERQNLPV